MAVRVSGRQTAFGLDRARLELLKETGTLVAALRN